MENWNGVPEAGWLVSPSIALELDFALSAVGGSIIVRGAPTPYADVLAAVPSDWQAELPELLGHPRTLISLLGSAAYLAGTLVEGEYARATLPIRELSIQIALDRLGSLASGTSIEIDEHQKPAERLASLYINLVRANLLSAGFVIEEFEPLLHLEQQQILHLTRIIQGGDLAARFWMWLDRFAYQVYLPWRAGQRTEIQGQIDQATAQLGAVRGDHPPRLDWLPAPSVMLRRPALIDLVKAGRTPVFFWASPFSADAWDILPDMLMTTFGELGTTMENFRSFASNVAQRTAALGDPTRLMILRLIRHFGMDNTEIASFLGISRPTVSIHAKILRDAGLIDTVPQGRSVRHTIKSGAVRALFHDLERLLDLPDQNNIPPLPPQE